MPVNSVNTNAGAIIALQSLNNTNSSLDSTQKRISTGFKVADNVDDGATFAIAQGLRGDLKAYEAVNSQLNQTRGVVNVASAAATNISNTLADIEGVLVQLADGAVTGDQRTQLASEYASLKTEITNFISQAEFNGTNILDNSSGASITTIQDAEGGQLSITAYDLATTISSNLGTVADASAAQTLLSGSFATAVSNIGTTLAQLGQATRSIDNQIDFVDVLSDATEVGIGDLVDADLAKESARLESLQIQQQLGTQALGIANNAPSILLALFN